MHLRTLVDAVDAGDGIGRLVGNTQPRFWVESAQRQRRKTATANVSTERTALHRGTTW